MSVDFSNTVPADRHVSVKESYYYVQMEEMVHLLTQNWHLNFSLELEICSLYFSVIGPDDRQKVGETHCFSILRKILVIFKMGKTYHSWVQNQYL